MENMRIMIITLNILILGIVACRRDKRPEISNEKISGDAIRPTTTPCKSLGGQTYYYPPSSKGNDPLFVLRFTCVADTLNGLLIGSSAEGEHGLYYYKSQVRDLTIDDSFNVFFSVIPGELYEERISLENNKNTRRSSGVLRSELVFKGTILNDTVIILHCLNEYNDCITDETMEFVLDK